MIKVTCDRCKKEVKEFLISEGYTGGYYQVTFPSYWNKFANEGEDQVCDSCMHKDERYMEVYGKQNG